ncbi:MAG TPA: metallophosphoesterase [Candidatus Polarisedimenticolaceae bacterium]|nr:metallophosphoesterase [Candidatus Polarisedimenticolaceae bacterium]
MGSLFALADLHLSAAGAKPMHVFGELWRDHAERMARAWDEAVGADDTVLLPGDLSWARNLSEVAPDLAWIAARPGRKLLLRGNHDSWWSSPGRVRAALPSCCEVLQNNALEFDDWVIVGARGWTDPDDPFAKPGDDRVFARELERLQASVADADARFDRGRPRLAMTHFPPWIDEERPTRVVGLLRRAGVRLCVYGHLHGEDQQRAVRGERDGIRFVFVAADAVRFRPVPIDLAFEPLR